MKDFFSLNEESEQQQNGFFSVSMEFLCITNELGEILKTNPLWEIKLGYLAPELIGKKLTDFVHPNDTENLTLITKKIPLQKERRTFTSRLRSKDDSYRFVIWQFQWLDGLIYGAAKDLTELYQTKKDAESAVFIKNQLISMLSNEIQEPLKSLSLFLEIMGKTQSPVKQKICLENIRLSTDFLDNLINGMIVTDKTKLTEQQVISFDLYTTIEDAIIPLIVTAKRHNISIDLSIHPQTPPTVVGNPQRLKQALSYLILNAIKCLERGKISIEATPEETSKAVFKIYFNVKTSGIVPLKDNPFSPISGSNGNWSHDDNSNFSLELVKSLVETLNGKLSVSRNSEGNNEFSFHMLLLKDDVQNSKEDNNVSMRVLPMYNKNIRLKDEELLAIEKISSEQAKLTEKNITEIKPRILVVDDSPVNTELLAGALIKNYEVSIANSGKDALSLVQQIPVPDVILLDLNMPDMSGYEVAKQIQLEESTRNIPVIFLTILSDSENEANDLRSGAADFISKPFDLPSVLEKIKYQLALKHYREILSVSADTDALTQIPNRRRFDEMLAIEIRKAKRNNTPLSVIQIDIDYFKQYNESYGHLAGDDCLREVAFTIKKVLKRAGDLAARWSGQEFACLLPDTNIKGAAHVAENISRAVLNLRIPHHASPVAKTVTLSLGVATAITAAENSGADSFDELIDHAQAALIQAKESGRNRVLVYRE